MFKKISSLMIIGGLAFSLVACGSTSNPDDTDTGFDTSAAISVYTRDSTSGTREAFLENGLGDKAFELTSSAVEVSSNGDMLTKVTNDINGIGYASLDSTFTDALTLLSFNGITPSKETVLDGTYEISRPFNLVTRASGDFESDTVETLVAAFVDFAMNSEEGQDVVAGAGGIVDTTTSTPWAELKTKYESVLSQDNSSVIIKTSGSTSVEKVLTALIEAFTVEAGNVQIQQNQTGSGDGYKRVLGSEKDSANAASIGFASRAFSSEENVTGALVSGTICLDAVVVFVNSANSITNITTEQAQQIFGGEATKWSDIEG